MNEMIELKVEEVKNDLAKANIEIDNKNKQIDALKAEFEKKLLSKEQELSQKSSQIL